jgi:large subunit ribosomal protein L30
MPRTHVFHGTKGPKHTAKALPIAKGNLRIEQVRSGIGHSWRMKQTLEALGLRHHQDVVIKKDSESLRGMLNRVRHLVVVTPEEK